MKHLLIAAIVAVTFWACSKMQIKPEKSPYSKQEIIGTWLAKQKDAGGLGNRNAYFGEGFYYIRENDTISFVSNDGRKENFTGRWWLEGNPTDPYDSTLYCTHCNEYAALLVIGEDVPGTTISNVKVKFYLKKSGTAFELMDRSSFGYAIYNFTRIK